MYLSGNIYTIYEEEYNYSGQAHNPTWLQYGFTTNPKASGEAPIIRIPNQIEWEFITEISGSGQAMEARNYVSGICERNY